MRNTSTRQAASRKTAPYGIQVVIHWPAEISGAAGNWLFQICRNVMLVGVPTRVIMPPMLAAYAMPNITATDSLAKPWSSAEPSRGTPA